ncbi:hypothetical protein F5Y09DRAFT_325441 [Xylaria sp. FL1042]|nr:hypothetical protein F5Y09DRAFT_325441 [Xylaria sp. FL1042]
MGRTPEDFAASPIPNGIQHVSEKGIAGRAVLIDWYAWAQTQNKTIDVLSSHEIPFAELLETLKHQGISLDIFRPGDIIVIRSGYLLQYETLNRAKADTLNEYYKTHKPDNIGLEPLRELLEFLWDRKIAAVCGDSRFLEVWPCTELEWHMHEWLLAGWGMLIGELFHLEKLSELCARLKRYTFFLSSCPMNVPGGVASPSNALAFF